MAFSLRCVYPLKIKRKGYISDEQARASLNLDNGVAVARNQWVMSNQSHRFNERLGDKDAVEWILVVRGQFFYSYRVFSFDGQEAITGFLKMAHCIVA
jgi:hypothetical protein